MIASADHIRKIIAEQLNVPVTAVVDDASFTDDLGADSLDKFELSMSFEEHFGIEISDEDIESFRTVSDVIRRLNAEPAKVAANG